MLKNGTRRVESALGAVDPRELKTIPTKSNISCWLDIEQAGQVGSDFPLPSTEKRIGELMIPLASVLFSAFFYNICVSCILWLSWHFSCSLRFVIFRRWMIIQVSKCLILERSVWRYLRRHQNCWFHGGLYFEWSEYLSSRIFNFLPFLYFFSHNNRQ